MTQKRFMIRLVVNVDVEIRMCAENITANRLDDGGIACGGLYIQYPFMVPSRVSQLLSVSKGFVIGKTGCAALSALHGNCHGSTHIAG